ncbi:MAG: beta-ketoacyl-ACP synthase III [Prochlorotrichaceae cyanobacterium]
MIGIAITGHGSATPTTSVSNDALSAVVDTSDEWIRTRTGIQERCLASPDVSLTDLALQAGQAAIASCQLQATDLDLIILATSTPDDLFGSAVAVQHRLGATRAVGFDLTAACSGFLFGLVTAAQFIQNGTYQRILLIGADMLSRWVDWSDRGTCVLFGDGAGAIVLEASDTNHLLGFELRSDGTQNRCLNLSYQPTPYPLLPEATLSQGRYHPITMNGKEVYRFAVQQVPEVLEKALFRAGLTTAEVDWLLLHQANQRILDAVADRLSIPRHKVLSNLAHYGNTSAATIPLMLDEAIRGGQVKPGDVVAASGFGAGLSWGAAIFRYG